MVMERGSLTWTAIAGVGWFLLLANALSTFGTFIMASLVVFYPMHTKSHRVTDLSGRQLCNCIKFNRDQRRYHRHCFVVYMGYCINPLRCHF